MIWDLQYGDLHHMNAFWIDASGAGISFDLLRVLDGQAACAIDVFTARVPAMPCLDPGFVSDPGTEEPNTDDSELALGLRVACDEGSGSDDRGTFVEPTSIRGVSSIRDEIQLLGALGHYAFVQRSRWSLGCGAAHGDWVNEVFVVDVRAGRRYAVEDVIVPNPEERERARDALRVEYADCFEEDWPEDPQFVGVRPIFDREGMRLALRFAGISNYACSGPDGSAYTTSTEIETERLGPLLTPLLPLPAAARRHLARRGRAPVHGVTWSGPAD